MIFSLKPTTSRRWPSWGWIPVAVTLLLFLASGFVGLSDDESYYWVLAQKPALGYAFHPPMVAWMIFLAQKSLSFFFSPSSPWIVRFFSCSCMGFFLWLTLDWVGRAGGKRIAVSALGLVSFAGVFGLGWMMVPDVPLILGWILSFYACWRIANDERENPAFYFLLGIGVLTAILGKYSGILVPFSALVSLFTGPHGRFRFFKSLLAAAIGTVFALVPILIWNSQHEWASILYQIQERHEGAQISFKRYLRFWVIELFAAGPFLVIYSLGVIRRAFKRTMPSEESRVFRFIAVWMGPPALIYLIQPLWSDFKPHWAFIVWLPGAMALAWEMSRERVRFATAQIVYGLTLIFIVLVSLQFPLMALAVRHFKGKDYDPRLDVTNDLYGWSRLQEFAREHRDANGRFPFFTASHYQTASQAAAALGSVDSVSMLPRDLKARDEWPILPVSKGIGPDWPELTQPVFYVGDNRYDAPPDYKSARCDSPVVLESRRDDLVAKRILVWRCRPANWRD